MRAEKQFGGRVAFITGAEQGIGRAIALRFAQAGADLVINFLSDHHLAQTLVEECAEFGSRAIAVRGDVSQSSEVEGLVQSAQDEFGRIDILVNNAGIFPRVPFLQMGEGDWDKVLDVNLKGSFLCARASAPHLLNSGSQGAIINLSSGAVRGMKFGAHYSASKGGLISLTRTLALELAPYGVRVNAVAPGLIDTTQPRQGHDEDELREMGRALPLGRLGRPDDVASAVLFLASDEASFVTGQTLYVNGGGYMP